MPGFNIPFTPEGCPIVEQGQGPSHTVETARNHRYMLEVLEPFGNKSNGLLYFLEKCDRPSMEFDKMLIHSAQDEISRPGKIHWKDIEFTFYEKLSGQKNGELENQTAKMMYEWWSKTQLNIDTSLFNPPSTYMKEVQLQMLGGH